MNFLEKIKVLYKYPNMYFPSGSLAESTSYVAGMDIMNDSPIGESFRSWLIKNKLKEETSFSW